jgi:tetratricopeptide (TPR) repeat protein
MIRLVALVSLSLIWTISSLPAAHGQVGRPEGLYYKSWAVVIGIDDYQVAPKLGGAVADAKAVAAVLRQLGFEEVVEIYNKDAKFRHLKAILDNDLPRKVGRQDRVLLFFAGHAGVTRDMNGKDLGYLVPWDAQPNNVSKAITLDDLKEFSRRVMSKHTLFILDVAIAGWDVTPPQQFSSEGRLSPEEETDKRAVQLLTAAGKGEALARKDGRGLFVQAVLSGLKGAADEDKNGWVMASELGGYVKRQAERATGGAQHPQFVRLDGDGDTVLVEGKKSAFQAGPAPKTDAERTAAARQEYDKALAILQQRKPLDEAVERLDKAIAYDPSFGEAYVMKSFLYLERLSKPDEALATAQQAVKHAPGNRDSHYILGLALQQKGRFDEAERAMRQALAVDPNYSDVYLALGDLYAERLKDPNKAVEAYQRYLETGGNEDRVREYLKQAGAGVPAEKQ